MSLKSARMVVELSMPELRTLRLILDHPFDRPEDFLAGIVGPHHHQKKAAQRMREKILQSIEGAKILHGRER
jgi:hypothetical protein